MLDQITGLERQLIGMDNEKKQVLVRIVVSPLQWRNSLFVLKEKIGLTKSSESRLADEKRQLKRALDECEARAIELEMNRRGLEGEIQRLNMILTDKDTEIQVHQERCDTLIKQIQVRAKEKGFSTPPGISRIVKNGVNPCSSVSIVLLWLWLKPKKAKQVWRLVFSHWIKLSRKRTIKLRIFNRNSAAFKAHYKVVRLNVASSRTNSNNHGKLSSEHRLVVHSVIVDRKAVNWRSKIMNFSNVFIIFKTKWLIWICDDTN